MANILQIKRGSKANLPTLNSGELGFCTDTKEFFVGDGLSNYQVLLYNLFDSNTILIANSNNTPVSLTISGSQLIGRKSYGGIDSLTAEEVRTILNIEDGAKDNTTLIVTVSGVLSSEIDSDIVSHAASGGHDWRYYTESEVDDLIAAASGTTDHSVLDNLDYASAGHTGFASTASLTSVSGVLQSEIDGLLSISSILDLGDTPTTYDSDKYLRSTASGTVWATVSGSGGTSDHSGLINLDYDSSGHTGFASTASLTSVSGTLQIQIDGKADIIHTHDDRYYTESEVDAISGTLSSEIDSDITAHAASAEHDGRYYTESEVDAISGTLSSEIDSDITAHAADAVMKSDFTAQGDLLAATASGVPTAFSAGGDGAVLSANSGESAGLKWISFPEGLTWTIITGSVSAVANTGYLIDASSGTVTVTLPSPPSQGFEVAFTDYKNMATTNTITIARNGSKIEGIEEDLVIDIDGAGFTLAYTDSDRGWEIVSQIGYQYLDAVLRDEFNVLHGIMRTTTTSGAPDVYTVPENTLVGRTTGNIVGLTASGVRDLINVDDGATDNTALIVTVSGVLQTEIDSKADSSHTHDGRYYTESEVDAISGTLSSEIDSDIVAHAVSAAHDDRYYTESEIDTISGSLSNEIDSDIVAHAVSAAHDGRYYTESEVDAVSGTLQNNIDYKSVLGVTQNYWVTLVDFSVFLDGTSSVVHAYLPTASGIDGKIYNFKCINANNNCYVVTSGTEKLDGSSNDLLLSNMESVTIQSYSNAWWKI